MTDGSGLTALAAGLSIGLPAFGVAIGQGLAAFAALNGIARQPEVRGDLRANMIFAMAFTEALAIYGLVIAILLYVKV
ncbi:MAG: ATP synthase F0 subunit C [Firmicutes bacterium]|nr:ATP synthase F0 subunit C [Bacillota bacterium]